MKKLLLILLTLSVISVGCSDDEEIIQPTTNLDSNLFGVWIWTNLDIHTETYTFFSDETWTFDFLNSTFDFQYSGTWLVQNQMLYLSHLTPSNDEETIPYSIQGDSLIFETNSIIPRIFIKQ